jgi:AbrB family looped-hinge helix DNA binding protein
MATVTSKGQVTLSKMIRDALGIQPSTDVEFDLEDGQVVTHELLREP